ncbi:malto-oligosyltrehalose trehalohydrolase, partial [Pseudomonas syringae pv. tagetis]
PASRAQAGDVHTHSIVVDPHAYSWQNTSWNGRPRHEAVNYELHVGAMGGYAAVEKHLQRIAEMSITAIELMPLSKIHGAR